MLSSVYVTVHMYSIVTADERFLLIVPAICQYTVQNVHIRRIHFPDFPGECASVADPNTTFLLDRDQNLDLIFPKYNALGSSKNLNT